VGGPASVSPQQAAATGAALRCAARCRGALRLGGAGAIGSGAAQKSQAGPTALAWRPPADALVIPTSENGCWRRRDPHGGSGCACPRAAARSTGSAADSTAVCWRWASASGRPNTRQPASRREQRARAIFFAACEAPQCSDVFVSGRGTGARPEVRVLGCLPRGAPANAIGRARAEARRKRSQRGRPNRDVGEATGQALLQTAKRSRPAKRPANRPVNSGAGEAGLPQLMPTVGAGFGLERARGRSGYRTKSLPAPRCRCARSTCAWSSSARATCRAASQDREGRGKQRQRLWGLVLYGTPQGAVSSRCRSRELATPDCP